MDVEIINAFVSSTTNTFESMIGQSPKRLPPRIKDDSAPIYDVIASLGVTGPYTGIVTVNFNKAAACNAASAMLGEEHDELDEIVMDAVGEIVNIIVGGAKASGLNYKLSLPNVCSGHDLTHQFPPGVPSILIPFESDTGQFTVEVCMKKNGDE
jgi:chemotaxis protein CheX